MRIFTHIIKHTIASGKNVHQRCGPSIQCKYYELDHTNVANHSNLKCIYISPAYNEAQYTF